MEEVKSVKQDSDGWKVSVVVFLKLFVLSPTSHNKIAIKKCYPRTFPDRISSTTISDTAPGFIQHPKLVNKINF